MYFIKLIKKYTIHSCLLLSFTTCVAFSSANDSQNSWSTDAKNAAETPPTPQSGTSSSNNNAISGWAPINPGAQSDNPVYVPFSITENSSDTNTQVKTPEIKFGQNSIEIKK